MKIFILLVITKLWRNWLCVWESGTAKIYTRLRCDIFCKLYFIALPPQGCYRANLKTFNNLCFFCSGVILPFNISKSCTFSTSQPGAIWPLPCLCSQGSTTSGVCSHCLLCWLSLLGVENFRFIFFRPLYTFPFDIPPTQFTWHFRCFCLP